MAKRNRYKEMEYMLTRALIADVIVFVLYMIFAFAGITALKVITAIIAILLSGLCLAFLYMSGEIMKLRSRWMVMGFGAVVLCLLVSLVLKYPAPALPKTETLPTSSVTAEMDQDAANNDSVSDQSSTLETGVG